MVRTDNLRDFAQDIAYAVKKRTGNNSPIRFCDLPEEILNIKTDSVVNGINEEYENNGDYSIGEFVGLKNSSLVSLNSDTKIYGMVTELRDNVVVVARPGRDADNWRWI